MIFFLTRALGGEVGLILFFLGIKVVFDSEKRYHIMWNIWQKL